MKYYLRKAEKSRKPLSEKGAGELEKIKSNYNNLFSFRCYRTPGLVG